MDVAASATARVLPPWGRTRWGRLGARAGGLVLGIAVLTAWFNAAAVHAFAGTSDGATVVLEGAALTHGALTLQGWSLSLDSFWTVDAVFYAAVIAIRGLRADEVHVVPALLGSLVVILAIWLAGRGSSVRGRVAAGLVVLVVIAIPSHALAFFFLQGPWHVGTALYCLAAFALMSRSPTRLGCVAAVLLLAAGLLGDLQTLALGVLPLALGGLVAAARTRRVRAGVPDVLVALAAVLLAAVIRLVTLAIGAFRVEESHRTVSLLQAESNLGHLLNWTAALLGVHQGAFGGPAVSHLLEAPRVLVVAGFVLSLLVATVGLILGVIGPSRDADGEGADWRLDDLLVLGCLASIGVFEYLTLSNNLSYARYLDPLVIFGTVLMARQAARLGDRCSPRVLLAGAAAVVLVAAGSLAVLSRDLGATPPPPATSGLERFLGAHGLRVGIGDYWAASVVTVDTRGAISIRPVVADPSGHLVADGRNASAAWYHGTKFQFLVYDELPYGRVELKTVEKTFGKPARQYAVGRYTVVVWRHPLRLGPTTFP